MLTHDTALQTVARPAEQELLLLDGFLGRHLFFLGCTCVAARADRKDEKFVWCTSREEGRASVAGSTCGRPVNSGYQRREKKGERSGGGYCVCNEGRRELCSLLSCSSLLVGGGLENNRIFTKKLVFIGSTHGRFCECLPRPACCLLLAAAPKTARASPAWRMRVRRWTGLDADGMLDGVVCLRSFTLHTEHLYPRAGPAFPTVTCLPTVVLPPMPDECL